MKRTTSIIFLFSLLYSCVDRKNQSSPTHTEITYSNACCCNTIFSAGSGSIFIPSMFTPNADGINDSFRPIGNSNTKYIYDVKITDAYNNLLYTIDTCFGTINSTSWNGYINANTRHRGIIQVSCKVLDLSNIVSVISAQSCSFVCDIPSNVLTNLPNCKFESMYDPVSGSTPYASGETDCFY